MGNPNDRGRARICVEQLEARVVLSADSGLRADILPATSAQEEVSVDAAQELSATFGLARPPEVNGFQSGGCPDNSLSSEVTVVEGFFSPIYVVVDGVKREVRYLYSMGVEILADGTEVIVCREGWFFADTSEEYEWPDRSHEDPERPRKTAEKQTEEAEAAESGTPDKKPAETSMQAEGETKWPAETKASVLVTDGRQRAAARGDSARMMWAMELSREKIQDEVVPARKRVFG